ncbi:MAG: hypothetical protein K6T65_05220 [Peptococcaceae bacterium]|nr:hypothetical protein [Peptococcaceae bacterium]
MNYKSDKLVESALEELIQKIERLSREKKEKVEESRRTLASIGRLSDAVMRLEQQKRREKAMAEKITALYHHLERTPGDPAESFGKTLGQAVNGLLNGAKITGQIIQIVASSLQVMIESVGAVIKNQKSAGNRNDSPAGEAAMGVDLVELLKPINSFLNSLAAKSQAPAQPDQSNVIEAEVKGSKKEENYTVPVVKAVSASDNLKRDIG